jgi:hypothetical protein
MFAREIQKSPRASMHGDGSRHHFFMAFWTVHCFFVRHDNRPAAISATASIRENPRHPRFLSTERSIIPPLPAQSLYGTI